MVEQGQEPTCPICRGPLEITMRYARQYEAQVYHLDPPEAQEQEPASTSDYETGLSAQAEEGPEPMVTLPWWPVADEGSRSICEVYHQSTQLQSGQNSFIVDPGAWTNLIGARQPGSWPPQR